MTTGVWRCTYTLQSDNGFATVRGGECPRSVSVGVSVRIQVGQGVRLGRQGCKYPCVRIYVRK